MKRYYVTVNGNRYEVEIEEVKGEFTPKFNTASAPNAEPSVKSAPHPPATEPKTNEYKEQENKETPKAVNTTAGGEKVECPMPGTILKVNASEGVMIKKGDVMFVLEAMKMENEIMAPRDGKVIQVAVVKGAVVNTGDTLAILE